MSKKITDSAKGRDCTIRIPGVCNYRPETTVFAHINGIRYGHGIGKKTILGAYCCSSCHDVLDMRVKSKVDLAILKLWHLEGVMETLCIMNSEGLISLE